MPVRLQFGPEDLLRCRFAVSPLCETHEAVRTLRRSERHGYHLPWLNGRRAALARLDLSALWLFMPAHGGYTPDFLAPPPAASADGIDAELARMRATDPALAHSEMARSLACTPGATESKAGRAMLADPGRAVRLLADATERAWQALLADDWPRVTTVLEADIAHRSGRLAQGGLESLFTDLHPELRWTQSALVLRSRDVVLRQRDLDGRGLLLMPSVFVWPNVIGGFAAPWQPTVIYPARGMGDLWQPPAPRRTDPLARLLGGSRAAVLAGLDEAASTSALARRLGLAPSSVSEHLAVLRDAGLLTSRRSGHQVLYRRTALGTALLEGTGA